MAIRRISAVTLSLLAGTMLLQLFLNTNRSVVEEGADEDAAELIDLLSLYKADYDPADSPSALAEASDTVVLGRIVGVADGRVFGTGLDDETAIRTAVIHLRVDDVLAGEVSGVSESAFIEILRPDFILPNEIREAAPADARVLAYLVTAPDAMPDEPIFRPHAGRPAGSPLMLITSPQGLLIEDRSGVHQLLESSDIDLSSEVTITDFYPNRRRFPASYASAH